MDYAAERTHHDAPAAAFGASYRPTGPVYYSVTGSLDGWLTDRYCLYSADRAGQVFRSDIDHERWPLQSAEAEIRVNTLGDGWGIEMKGPPASLHFAKALDVRAWWVERV